jgi:hypothetical protein
VKRLSDQTLYEILEVPVDAPAAEIERAWQRARDLYGPGSLATYALMSPDEATLLNNRIEEAHAVLLDPDARSRYDERIGARPRAAPPSAEPAPAAPAGADPGSGGVSWPSPEPPAVTPVPEAAVATTTAEGPAPPAAEPPIALQAPIATPPPGLGPAEAGTSPPGSDQPPAPIPASPGTAPLAPSPAAGPVPAPPIPLRQELPAPRDLLVPEGSRWTGEMLRQVREARGLTLRQISDRTKVTRHHIENVEADRFEALPAPVYLRGILMSLARELRLDGQKVARSYLERLAAAQPADPGKR